MAGKCVHKGCGKSFADPDEACIYHPGPPVFHEGQKGWNCCKPRVLTFDEFLSIPPCTTGKHSTVDDTPKPPEKPTPNEEPTAVPAAVVPTRRPITSPSEAPDSSASIAPQAAQEPATAVVILPDSDSDEPGATIPPKASCRRRGCNFTFTARPDSTSRDDEECIYHPGQPIFHEGSKGWTCCKRRVLEFDEFMKIEGCKKRKRHLFVRKKKDDSKEEQIKEVRHDFYQTPTTVIASLFLKKIDKSKAKVQFASSRSVTLDLPTVDNKRYQTELPTFGEIDTAKSTFKIMGTKLELTLMKADGASWPVLRSDEKGTGDIIQVGQAGRA